MEGTNRGGSFTLCTARYKGQRDPAAIDEFLAAISVYKDREKISDADAIKEMSFLLEDYAAKWWIGVKDTVSSFEEAKIHITTKFSPPIPDWQIFVNIFDTKQQIKEPTDSFVCQKRLLFSQLKVGVTEEVQVNMIYGLLNKNIRERVRRENIKTFGELISASREAEMFFTETRPVATNVEIKQESSSQSQTIFMQKPTLPCYGCDAPGVYRANCPKCCDHSKDSPSYLSFNSFSYTVIGHPLPATHIEVFGLKREAVLDTGSKISVASRNLKKILTKNSCIFQDVLAEIPSSDGSPTTGKVTCTICDVVIGGRLRKIRLVYLPNATKSRTLLGSDFLEQSGIVINMAQRCWYFVDQPETRFLFINPLEIGVFGMDLNCENNSPCSKAIKEVSDFIKFVEDKKIISPLPCCKDITEVSKFSFLVDKEIISPLPNTPKVVENFLQPVQSRWHCSDVKVLKKTLLPKPKSINDYSPQLIQNIFRGALPAGEEAPVELSKLFAPPIKIRKPDQDGSLA